VFLTTMRVGPAWIEAGAVNLYSVASIGSSVTAPADAEGDVAADAEALADSLAAVLGEAFGLAEAALGAPVAAGCPLHAASVPRRSVRIPITPAARPGRTRASTTISYLIRGLHRGGDAITRC
jgi:hypothetical protein